MAAVTCLSEIAGEGARSTRATPASRGDNALMGGADGGIRQGPRGTWLWNPTHRKVCDEWGTRRSSFPVPWNAYGQTGNSRRTYSIAAARDASRPSS